MGPNSLIATFAKHPVAANLLMVTILLLGVWSYCRLNSQLLPTSHYDQIIITTDWLNSNAQEIAQSITTPIEIELQDIPYVKEIYSTSFNNRSQIFINFTDKVNMNQALSKVRDRVNNLTSLPTGTKKPIIEQTLIIEPIAKLLLYGPSSVEEMRSLAHQIKKELKELGIARIEITGLPDQEIHIELPTNQIRQQKKSLVDIAQLIHLRSQDISIGNVGEKTQGKLLRGTNKRRSVEDFKTLPLLTNHDGQAITLGEISEIRLAHKPYQPLLFHKGQPAVEIALLRAEHGSILEGAKFFEHWLTHNLPYYGDSIKIAVYQTASSMLQERLDLMFINGFQGLVLILIVLFVFLNMKVAFWVASGIPVAIFAAITFLDFYGGSINMISLFAIIMSFGIIVDDTVVVGEEAVSQHHSKQALPAVVDASKKMIPPILASSITTIVAFLPLVLISDLMGKLTIEIPIVVICVILASLLECFFILPGHLYQTFKQKRKPIDGGVFRHRVNCMVENLTFTYYKPALIWTIHHPWTIVLFTSMIALISLGLVMGRHVPFNFFPAPDGMIILADIRFIEGATEEKKSAFMRHLTETLYKTEQEFQSVDEKILVVVVENKYLSNLKSPETRLYGKNEASLVIEVVSPAYRKTLNQTFIDNWKLKINNNPIVQALKIADLKNALPKKTFDIHIYADNPETICNASREIISHLKQYPGINDIENQCDNIKNEVRYQLTPEGKALGLTEQAVGQQIRAALSGQIVQSFYQFNEKIDVIVQLNKLERQYLSLLDNFPIVTPTGLTVPLNSIVSLDYLTSPSSIFHFNQKQMMSIQAELDASKNKLNDIIDSLNLHVYPDIMKKYNVDIKDQGLIVDQRRALGEMTTGMMLGLPLIFIILAWTFASYGLPFIILLVVPLALTGGIWGHFLLGIDLTMLSLTSFFGLSGIIVNDASVLVNEFLIQRKDLPTQDAIIEAGCKRLRPILLTSLTTIVGLLPLMFERSLQAQFLIPMATSIIFGLALGTLLLLFFMPATLLIYTQLKQYAKTFQRHNLWKGLQASVK